MTGDDSLDDAAGRAYRLRLDVDGILRGLADLRPRMLDAIARGEDPLDAALEGASPWSKAAVVYAVLYFPKIAECCDSLEAQLSGEARHPARSA